MVRAQDVSLQRVILFTGGEAQIGIGGFVAGRSDLAAFVEIFQHWQAPAGIMRDTPLCIFCFPFSQRQATASTNQCASPTKAPAGIWPDLSPTFSRDRRESV